MATYCDYSFDSLMSIKGISSSEYKNLTCLWIEDPKTDFERAVRGMVFDSDKNLIFKSFNSPTEVVNFSGLDLEKYRCTIMMEGTTIRLFNYNQEWIVSTHKKLDAFKSKWGAVSFGEIFEHNIKIKTGLTLEEFLSTLDRTLSYTFLVGTNDYTRIVSPKKDFVYLIACRSADHSLVYNESMADWYQKELVFKNLNVNLDNDKYVVYYNHEKKEKILKGFVSTFKYPFDKGYGVYMFSENGSFFIKNETYKYYETLRNNLPSINFAYLHNVFDEKKKSDFKNMYKNNIETFEKYDNELDKFIVELQSLYVDRYIKKKQFLVNTHVNYMLYKIHGEYLSSRIPANYDTIIRVLQTVPPTTINKTIQDRLKPKPQ